VTAAGHSPCTWGDSSGHSLTGRLLHARNTQIRLNEIYSYSSCLTENTFPLKDQSVARVQGNRCVGRSVRRH
jgi:hypothetical protein